LPDDFKAPVISSESREAEVQTLFGAVLEEACAAAQCGLRVDDSSATPICGYPRRPDFCVLPQHVCLTISEAVLVVELKGPRFDLEDARRQLNEYLGDQVRADQKCLRRSFLGFVSNGVEVMFVKLDVDENGDLSARKSGNYALWQDTDAGRSIDPVTFRAIVAMFHLAREVTGTTTVEASEELREITGVSEDAKFGVISDDASKVVYWCKEGQGGCVFKGFENETSWENEARASELAKEGAGATAHYFATVERVLPRIRNAVADSLASKFWLKVTPLGKVSFAEVDYLLEVHRPSNDQVTVFEWMAGCFSCVEAVLSQMHRGKRGHWDVKPSNIVLCHVLGDATEAKKIESAAAGD
jgi:hypothetical protein